MNFPTKIFVLFVCAVFPGTVFSPPAAAKEPVTSITGQAARIEPVGFELLPTGQMRFVYDLDGDGKADQGLIYTVVGFVGYPRTCADHDPRYLLVPRDGAYIIDARPVQGDFPPDERPGK